MSNDMYLKKLHDDVRALLETFHVRSVTEEEVETVVSILRRAIRTKARPAKFGEQEHGYYGAALEGLQEALETFDAERGRLLGHIGSRAGFRVADAVRELGRAKTRPEDTLVDATYLELAGGPPQLNGLGTEVRDALRRLPDDQRIAIYFHFWRDMPEREIAAALSWSKTRVHRQLEQAKAALGGALGEGV